MLLEEEIKYAVEQTKDQRHIAQSIKAQISECNRIYYGLECEMADLKRKMKEVKRARGILEGKRNNAVHEWKRREKHLAELRKMHQMLLKQHNIVDNTKRKGGNSGENSEP